MAKTFGKTERRICNLFSVGTSFYYGDIEFVVKNVGKPTCSRGEPKTDIYILAQSYDGDMEEFKISFKQSNADFLENKTNADRAEQLFGSDWEEVIYRATTNLHREFASRPLIYKTKYRRTEEGAITLGWKFELLNVDNGQLSGDMLLTRRQVIDVYAGTNLEGDKRDAEVNGRTVKDSGIANYILFEDDLFQSAQDVIDAMVSIEEYVDIHPNVYFACKALNYRTYRKKYDGNRPLAVYVDWSVVDGKLHPELCFDTPLLRGGDYVCDRLLDAMNQLGIRDTSDINADNVSDPSKIWE